MKSLRRYRFKNRLYFITSVTYNRQPLLLENFSIFWESWKIIKPIAWVILPDHFHIIINSEQQDILKIIHSFKRTYTCNYNYAVKSGRVWQNRYWDHIIRDQNDFNKHLDYIHYNPVKHKLTNAPFVYEHSSLLTYYEKGYYQRDWGNDIKFEDCCFGE